MLNIEKINSEEPAEHWSFLDVKNKIVLDLGCGKFYSSISTAQWFLDKEAKLVIAVDLQKEPINDERLIPYAVAISKKEDLEYFLKYNPEIIKCDIEGAEKFFNEIIQLPDSVTNFAVEYHDNDLKIICENAIKRWGFENTKIYQLFNENIDRVGVLHAWK
jgi:hypothetical protein